MHNLTLYKFFDEVIIPRQKCHDSWAKKEILKEMVKFIVSRLLAVTRTSFLSLSAVTKVSFI